MATDIASILVNTQTAINKAVETITATTETQRVLKSGLVKEPTRITKMSTARYTALRYT